MTEEIINADGSRNWQANILLDNIKRLEQENKQLTQWLDEARRNADFWCDKCTGLEQENKELKEKFNEAQDDIESLTNANNYYFKENKELRKEIAELRKDCNHCNFHTYRSALEEIRELEKLAYYSKGMPEEPLSQSDFILDAINNYEQRRIKILTKINEVLGC